jgi:hypothetical protein
LAEKSLCRTVVRKQSELPRNTRARLGSVPFLRREASRIPTMLKEGGKGLVYFFSGDFTCAIVFWPS